MFISGAQQTGSVIHARVSILFQILSPFRFSESIEELNLKSDSV